MIRGYERRYASDNIAHPGVLPPVTTKKPSLGWLVQWYIPCRRTVNDPAWEADQSTRINSVEFEKPPPMRRTAFSLVALLCNALHSVVFCKFCHDPSS